ncbi:hypothetical protein ABT336_13335 [Micromonospora sp. NPDC000207]|uniref:hypothetical protein n=1 Tax=Micromonospora sp. NPDC000207 TaxID=3154246 RepID=UPI00332C5D40
MSTEVGDAIEVTFTSLPGATVTAQVTFPSGAVGPPQPVDEDDDGEYPFTFQLTEPGMWRVQFTATGAVTATEPFWIWAEQPVPPLATAGQVAAVFRPLNAEEERLVSAWLAQASRLLRHRFPDLDDRIAAGTLHARTAADAAVSMVLRVARRPGALTGVGGLRSESTGPFRRDYYDSAADDTDLVVTDVEVALLNPKVTRAGRRGAGTIMMQPGMATTPVRRGSVQVWGH